MSRWKRLFFVILYLCCSACVFSYKDWCNINFGADFFCIENGKNQLFLVENEEISISLIPKLELGLRVAKKVFSTEWKQEDVEKVLDDGYINMFAYVPFEKFKGYPISCNADTSAGCYDVDYSMVWASSTKQEKDVEGNVFYVEREIAISAFMHEIVHAIELALENRIDYEHDDFIYRWSNLVPTAENSWQQELDNLGH